jgi:copper homeostasis protein
LVRVEVMEEKWVFEACIETLDQAVVAHREGAQQAEICSHLDLDGLTPEIDLVEEIIKTIGLGAKVMIRSRGGDFQYTQDEVNEMIRSILRFKVLRVAGFVFGATKIDTDNKTVLDMATLYQMCKAAHPYPVTIHKAIDVCSDIVAETEKLLAIANVDFILSSGGKPTAVEGISTLAAMQKSTGSTIKVIAAGKVTQSTIPIIHRQTGITYFHGKRIMERE